MRDDRHTALPLSLLSHSRRVRLRAAVRAPTAPEPVVRAEFAAAARAWGGDGDGDDGGGGGSASRASSTRQPPQLPTIACGAARLVLERRAYMHVPADSDHVVDTFRFGV